MVLKGGAYYPARKVNTRPGKVEEFAFEVRNRSQIEDCEMLIGIDMGTHNLQDGTVEVWSFKNDEDDRYLLGEFNAFDLFHVTLRRGYSFIIEGYQIEMVNNRFTPLVQPLNDPPNPDDNVVVLSIPEADSVGSIAIPTRSSGYRIATRPRVGG